MRLDQSKPRELDRRQWAGIDRLLYEFQANGRGEYFFEEPIYFGTAFASPPILSYSSVTDGFLGEPIVPSRTVPPSNVRKNVDSHSLTNHSLGANLCPINDPGFEVQGVWIPLMGDVAREIPITSDTPRASAGIETGWYWDEFPNQIYSYWADQGYSAQDPSGDRYPGWANHWIQTDDVRARWSVTDEKSHDYGIGFRGKYSAKVTLDSGSSNWLIAMGWQEGYVDDFYGDYPDTAHWGYKSLSSWGWWHGTQSPIPYGWNGTAAVWSDQDCELEVWTYHWWYYQDRDDWWDYEIMPFSETDSRPLIWPDVYNDDNDQYPMCMMGNNERTTVPIVGGEWNEVEYYLPRKRDQWQPTKPGVPSGPGWMYETFRFRINGSPGQTVYLDNVYVWPDIRNIYVPMVTIGVAEWVIDEQGAYIGVKPWIKVGDP